MKEFRLTQSYATIKDMLNSEEVNNIKIELQENLNIAEYAIVSRIGNHYDLSGNKIAQYAHNPYFSTVEETSVVVEENKKQGETEMKYAEIEALIDNEIAKAVEEVNARHEQELAELKEKYTAELENAKEAVKAEIIAKING